jgi:uncharacterized protein
MKRLPAIFALLLAFVSLPAHAQTVAIDAFPTLEGRVVDQAELLSADQEKLISAQSEALEKATGRQFVVATVKDLRGYEIRDYGYQLGRHWKIGTKGNDGVILLVAPTERKVTIEVGYGLEPILTDALSSLIINEQILPRFKAQDVAGGIIAGADAIVTQIGLPADQAAARQQQLLAERKRESSGGNPLILLFWLIVIAMIVLPMLSRLRGGRSYRGGRGPVVIWGPPSGGWGSSSGGSSWGGGGGGGGFSGGGGSFGGGGASGSW